MGEMGYIGHLPSHGKSSVDHHLQSRNLKTREYADKKKTLLHHAIHGDDREADELGIINHESRQQTVCVDLPQSQHVKMKDYSQKKVISLPGTIHEYHNAEKNEIGYVNHGSLSHREYGVDDVNLETVKINNFESEEKASLQGTALKISLLNDRSSHRDNSAHYVYSRNVKRENHKLKRIHSLPETAYPMSFTNMSFEVSKNERDVDISQKKTSHSIVDIDDSIYNNDIKKWEIEAMLTAGIESQRENQNSFAKDNLMFGAEMLLLLPANYSQSDKYTFLRNRYRRRNGVHIYDPKGFKELLTLYISMKRMMGYSII